LISRLADGKFGLYLSGTGMTRPAEGTGARTGRQGT
jgi:hypothetical protein